MPVPVILRSSQLLVDPEGRSYVAEIHGREAASGLWEGWIEFAALGEAIRLATAVETTQPDQRALEYWAGGLEPIYLEGAFTRAERMGSELSGRA